MEIRDTISRIEIARLLGVQTQTVARWERSGRFPHPIDRVSERVILYDRNEVERALRLRATKNRIVNPPQDGVPD